MDKCDSGGINEKNAEKADFGKFFLLTRGGGRKWGKSFRRAREANSPTSTLGATTEINKSVVSSETSKW